MSDRGLVVSSPMMIQGNTLLVKNSNLDRQELRLSLLFWDRLAWPASRIVYLGSGPDEQFLEDAGILSRPRVGGPISGDMAQCMAREHLSAFRTLEENEPGIWALAQGERSFLLKEGQLEEGRSLLVELHRAIPVPDKDVPLADILEFRSKRRDELLRLRAEIDTFYDATAKAADGGFELQRCVNQIELACADLFRASKEGRNPFRLADLKMSYELRLGSVVKDAAFGAAIGQTYNMPTLGALVGGGLGFLKVTRDLGIKGKHGRSPYWYVYNFHRDVFNEPG